MRNFIPKSFFFIIGFFLAMFSIVSTSHAAEGDPVEGGEQIEPPAVVQTVFTRRSVPNPSCLDNYYEWPHSGEYTSDNDWNVTFLPMEDSKNGPDNDYDNSVKRREHFIDLNGDGLQDYIYANHEFNIGNTGDGRGWLYRRHNQQCVYLHNGRGWDLVYRCIAHVDIPEVNVVNDDPHDDHPITQNYYGDCALVE